MGQIAQALLEAKNLAKDDGSPLLEYLIDMALQQCEEEEGARGYARVLPPASQRKTDGTDRRSP